MNLSSARPWVGTVARLGLAVVFFWSGVVKLADPRAVLRGVVAYRMTPLWLSKAIAYGLPTLELCLAAALAIGVLTRIAAATAGVLQLIFLIAILTVDARGLRIDSAVFTTGGVAVHGSYYLLVALLNVVLLAAAAFLYFFPYSAIGVDTYFARHDHVEMPSAKRMRTDQGRRKYEAQVAARARAARIRNRYLSAGVLLPTVLITFVAIGVQASEAKILGSSTTNASYINGVSVGVASSVTVDVFEDFQSPASLAFEQKVGSVLDALATGGKTQVRYHMVSLYNRASKGNQYSSRAAGASICASDISAEDFRKYHRYLYSTSPNGHTVMPTIGAHGRTDSAIIEGATKALTLTGDALSTFQTCVQGGNYTSFVDATTNNFIKRGFVDVPVVLVNGKRLHTLTAAALTSAAAGGVPVNKPAPASSSSSSATATASSSAASSSSSPASSSTSAAPSSSAAATSSPAASPSASP